MTAKLTYEDYCRIPDDGLRHEILDGEHVVSPSPNLAHQRVSVALTVLMVEQVERRGLGRVLTAPFDVILGPNDVVQPDVLVVVPAHASRMQSDGVHGAPDLVVEILSPSTGARDLGLKKARYEYAAVPEYWVVDPVAGTLQQFAFVGSGYEDRGTHGEHVQIAILPEVTLDLAAVWGAVPG